MVRITSQDDNVFRYSWYLLLMAFVFMALFLPGCCGPVCQIEKLKAEGFGGGQDVVTIDIPLQTNAVTLCTQGANGDYSHQYRTTMYDVDLDTPNDRDELVFAPVSGIAYVHDDSRTRNFGVHVNIDVGDGTYIILAHLDDVLIDDASEVVAGQLIAIEGTTGISVGDHLHVGRHLGNAARDGIYGPSVEGLAFTMRDFDLGGMQVELTSEEMICGIPGGHDYISDLETPRWHPDGSLVMVPGQSTVYLLDDWTARPFVNETAFLSRNFSFANVALISYEELVCYGAGVSIEGTAEVRAVYDNTLGSTWMLFTTGDGERYRTKVSRTGWQAVLRSWGAPAADVTDLEVVTSEDVAAYTATTGLVSFRDGTLVKQVDAPDVYVMSDGIARPIESWEDLLLLGWEDRDIIEVTDEEFDAVVTFVGSCTINSYCVSREDVLACGGLGESSEALYTPGDGDTASTEVVEPVDTAIILLDSGELPLGESFVLRWEAPGDRTVDRIALSGEYTRADGSTAGWQTFATQGASSYLQYEWLDANPGDSLRFSVEYAVDGATSWSCLAPFPPGTVQGSVTAEFRGEYVPVLVADDPSSNGCGLQVTLE